jgi:hypothetical protein
MNCSIKQQDNDTLTKKKAIARNADFNEMQQTRTP